MTTEERRKRAWLAFTKHAPIPQVGHVIPPISDMIAAIEAAITDALTIHNLDEAVHEGTNADNSLSYGASYFAIVKAAFKSEGLIVDE